MDDAKADGALQLLKNEIAAEIMSLTGMAPSPDGSTAGTPITGEAGQPMGGNADAASPILDEATALLQAGESDLRNRLVTEAYGTKLPQRRVPEDYEK
jgi:hypothetical protein